MTLGVTAVAIRDLTKSFGPVTVLSNVDLTFNYGEVHGLIGENGSGKSTLIKILAGFHRPDSGEIRIDAQPLDLPISARIRAKHRLTFVHQNLGLIPSLTVAENLLLDDLADPKRSGLFFSTTKTVTRAATVLSDLGIDIDPRGQVSQLAQMDRTRLAIARAAHSVGLVHTKDIEVDDNPSRGGGILVLDEPTAALTRDEVSALFHWTGLFARLGGAVLFVTHHLDEVLELTDRVTVLRDGKRIASQATSEFRKDELVSLIIGRPLAKLQSQVLDRSSKKTILRVDGLTSKLVHEIDFEVAAGEIVGITGRLGSGVDTVPYLLSGASPAASGTMLLGNRSFDLARLSPFVATKNGIVLIPSNRPLEGAVNSLSIGDNIEIPYDDYDRRWITAHKLRSNADAKIRRFDVRPRRANYSMGRLSGGNQQKGVLARWLSRDPKLVLLCHPTQGVDVGARQQIYEMLRAFAPNRATVCVSVDFEELEQLCDRVLIMDNGHLVAELSNDRVTAEAIADACLDVR